MFDSVSTDIPISQGDIIDRCPIFRLLPENVAVDLNASPDRLLIRGIIPTQACDIAQEKTTRIVIAQVYPAKFVVESNILSASVVRDRMTRGLVYGWYFFPASKSPEIPESVIDLRDLHTIHRSIIQRLVAGGNRVARFVTPYREHLAQQFSVTYSRIGLPEPYVSEP